MQRANMPTKFPIPFGNSAGVGYIRPIPEASQIGTNPGFASLEDGFVPDNMIPVASGGIPPFGQDMNGILNQVSAWARWACAGAVVVFDGTFSTSIGGYPKGSILASATVDSLFWSSAIDDNMTDPDVDATNWIPFSQVSPARIVTASGVFVMTRGDRSIGLNRTSSPATASSTLPATAAVGQEFFIDDLAGNFFLYNVTISAPGGMSINGSAGVVLDQDFSTNGFRYYGSNKWKWWTA